MCIAGLATSEADPNVTPEPPALLEAREAMEAAEFARVLASTTNAIASGALTSLQLQECYRIEGEALVAMGKASEARSAFSKLLLINPKAVLGEFVSPKITEELEAARSALAGAVLQAKAEARPNGGVAVKVTADPQEMSREVELAYTGSRGAVANVRSKLSNGSAAFDVPRGAAASVELRLLDLHGNTLAKYSVTRTVPVAVAVEAATKKNSVEVQPSHALGSRGWIGAAGGAPLAVVGGGFGLASQGSQDDLDEVLRNPNEHYFGEAREFEDRARSRARWANVSFAAAGSLVAASAYFYWRGRRDESPVIVPAIDDSGASTLQWIGTF
jgi:hypothetical protein